MKAIRLVYDGIYLDHIEVHRNGKIKIYHKLTWPTLRRIVNLKQISLRHWKYKVIYTYANRDYNET